MITVEKIAEGRFDTDMKYSFTEQGKAFGNIGEWLMFVDASQTQGDRALNRSSRQDWIQSSPASSISLETIDGFPAFKTGEGLTILRPVITVPQDEWTVVFVLGLHGASNGLRRNIFRSSSTTETDPDFLGMNILVGGSNGVSSLRLVTKGGAATDTPIRISYSAGSGTFRNKTFLAMFTFSKEEGLKLFLNGERKAERPEDGRPLTDGSTFELFPLLADGLCPEVLLNARDLSLIPGAIEAVSSFYANKYVLSDF